MSSESDMRRYRTEANKIRSDISKASAKVAAQRKKAADAALAASRSKIASTIKSKSTEAERATKAANDAEKQRADLEKKLADTEMKVAKSQERYEKERNATQAKAMEDLRKRTTRASSQFDPARSFGNSSAHGSFRSTQSRISVPERTGEVSDVFLSHASEDKEEIARPLKDALEARGLSVWFDEIKLKVGQSIRQEIEKGISACRFGVVIISPNFLAKQWTQAELDALFGRKMNSGEDLILPIWHHISKDEVQQHSPLLSGILALNSAIMTVDEMADSLAEVIRA